jgi:polyadenylate-binding protein 2
MEASMTPVDSEVEALRNRMIEMEEEAQKFKLMQQEVNKLDTLQDVQKEEADQRSIHVANVDYSSTPDELQIHFQSCGTINRITIAADKWTAHPKGYLLYIN